MVYQRKMRQPFYISHVERGVKKASLETLILTANTLGVTVNMLLYGNQVNDPAEYHPEILELLKDCDGYEKRVIFQNALEQKRILRDNRWLVNEQRERY